MFEMSIKSKRVRLEYGLRKSGVSRATFYRKINNHVQAPSQRVEPDGTVSFDRSELDRFAEIIKRERCQRG